MDKEYTHIELFAGCGGMSLGLKAADFDLFFANELSPMASETYAYNLLGEDLREIKKPLETVWLKSSFEAGDPRRLREDPTKICEDYFSDLKSDGNIGSIDDLKGKMVVGDIFSLIDYLKKNPSLISQNGNEIKIDLVSGGPPCQSFSLAGKREKNNKRNELPWAFVEFVNLVKPKIVLLENVSGILRAFNDGVHKYFAWFEVAKAFGLNGYIPICMHINAKFFGLPQNRPRFILLAIREDLANEGLDPVLDQSIKFWNKLKITGKDLKLSETEYKYYELEKKKDISSFTESIFLPKPIIKKKKGFLSVKYGIDILKNLENDCDINLLNDDPFHKTLEKNFGKFNLQKERKVKNHNRRAHSVKIQKRFQLLKIIEEFEKSSDRKKVAHALKIGTTKYLDKEILESLSNRLDEVDFFNDKIDYQRGEISVAPDFVDFDVFSHYKSRKRSQRALNGNQPAPATLSIPDDVCHYDPDQNRTLTVREMARLQSFPDWFVFRSKDTTGGINRRFEVPNYTQVGNAVPPLLGKALGEWLKVILEKI